MKLARTLNLVHLMYECNERQRKMKDEKLGYALLLLHHTVIVLFFAFPP